MFAVDPCVQAESTIAWGPVPCVAASEVGTLGTRKIELLACLFFARMRRIHPRKLIMSEDAKKHVSLVSYIQWAMLFVSLAIVVLLALKNRSLQEDYVECTSQSQYLQMRFKIQERFFLQLLNKRVPWDLSSSTFFPPGDLRYAGGKRFLLIVFNLTVCGNCLADELTLVKQFQHEISASQVAVLAIIGIAAQSERADVFGLRSSGILPFRFTFVSDSTVDKSLGIKADERYYLDTPVYILTDESLFVRNVFKPERSDPRTLSQWMKKVLSE